MNIKVLTLQRFYIRPKCHEFCTIRTRISCIYISTEKEKKNYRRMTAQDFKCILSFLLGMRRCFQLPLVHLLRPKTTSCHWCKSSSSGQIQQLFRSDFTARSRLSFPNCIACSGVLMRSKPAILSMVEDMDRRVKMNHVFKFGKLF